MTNGFFAGSFDPFTNGHLYVVKKAAKLFEKLYIGIGINPEKSRSYLPQDMRRAIEETLREEGIFNCEVVIYEHYTVEEAKRLGCSFLVRGVRNIEDYYYEEELAMMNKHIDSELTTILIPAENARISSSLVKQVNSINGDITTVVPPAIKKLMRGKNV